MYPRNKNFHPALLLNFQGTKDELVCTEIEVAITQLKKLRDSELKDSVEVLEYGSVGDKYN